MTSRREAIRARPKLNEHPDPTPIHIPGGHEPPLDLREEMRRFIRQEISLQARNEGYGEFTEEDDFIEEEGEIDLLSPYTVTELIDEQPTQYDPEAPQSPQEPPNAATGGKAEGEDASTQSDLPEAPQTVHGKPETNP